MQTYSNMISGMAMNFDLRVRTGKNAPNIEVTRMTNTEPTRTLKRSFELLGVHSSISNIKKLVGGRERKLDLGEEGRETRGARIWGGNKWVLCKRGYRTKRVPQQLQDVVSRKFVGCRITFTLRSSQRKEKRGPISNDVRNNSHPEWQAT